MYCMVSHGLEKVTFDLSKVGLIPSHSHTALTKRYPVSVWVCLTVNDFKNNKYLIRENIYGMLKYSNRHRHVGFINEV